MPAPPGWFSAENRSLCVLDDAEAHLSTEIPESWTALEAEYGDRLLGQLQNREWRSVHSRYGERFNMDYDEIVAWGKWVRGLRAAPKKEEQPADEDGADNTSYISDTRYWYDSERDVYVTFIPGVPQPLEVPGEVHRDMLKAYSNFDGNPSTINEICREFKMPRPWFEKYKRIHGWTKDHEPFTPDEMMERDEGELVDEALQLRRATFYRKFEQEKWKEVQAEAKKWREFESHVFRKIVEVIGGRTPPKPVQVKIKPARAPYAAVVGLSDFHWGKYSDGENWEFYDRKIARKRLFSCTEDVLSRLIQFGTPDKFIVPIGSDFLNIDNDQKTTTRGTPQDSDGNFYDIIETACVLMEEWIETLRQIAPVELVLMSGNHDRAMGYVLLLYLGAFYKNAADVTVVKNKQPRQYVAYGKNLIGLVHGDTVSKTKDLAGHMAREAAKEWAKCPYRTIYTGHLHYEKTETDVAYGVTRRQLPSLSGPDRWHARSGYVGAPKSLPLYLHDKERGLVAVIHGPPFE